MAQPGQPPDNEVRSGDDIDEVLSRANPNPERIGCPPRETLIALAARSLALGDPAYEHLSKCSPCYREFRALQEGRSAPATPSVLQSRRRWIGIAATIALVAGLAAVWLAFGRSRVPQTDVSVAPSQVAELRTELDLRKFVVTRAEQPTVPVAPVSLPVGLVDLTLLLPVGSEPGAYDIQLLDSELKSRATTRGVGEILNYVTTIRAKVDLRSVPTGNYQLAIRRDGDDWRMFPARVN
jgi:hypothetical protein